MDSLIALVSLILGLALDAKVDILWGIRRMVALSEDDVSNIEAALGILEVLETVDLDILVSESGHVEVRSEKVCC